jgi:hypothetical protein
MNIQQIAKKYKVSENFLNSKDDAFPVIAYSLRDIQADIQRISPNKSIDEKIDKLISFIADVKQSSI